MKIIHVNYSDFHGGAARASVRIHESLCSVGINSCMWVNKSNLKDPLIVAPSNNFIIIKNEFKNFFSKQVCKLLKSENPIIHSPSIFSSNWLKKINESDADIIHLHWIQGEMLSISDISKIKKPIVWTFHDMWPFCGAEHLSWDERWREGYFSYNRPKHEKGFDLNKWTWNRKFKKWKNRIQIVTPSKWMSSLVKESKLMRDWNVKVIPNPINTNLWKPFDKNCSRELLGLPKNKKLLLFGAVGGTNAYHKGFDLLMNSFDELYNKLKFNEFELVILGQRNPNVQFNTNYKLHYFGHLYDDYSLIALYSSVDAVVVPSRQDNFPQSATEAHACGIPVISFNIGGLSDIVLHKKTGYLAENYDSYDLAFGIKWVLTNPSSINFSQNSRQQALDLFEANKIAKNYINLYETILDNKK